MTSRSFKKIALNVRQIEIINGRFVEIDGIMNARNITRFEMFIKKQLLLLKEYVIYVIMEFSLFNCCRNYFFLPFDIS